MFAGRAVTLARLLRRWYLLPPRTRWAACTWPRSLSRIHLFRRVPTSDSPAWWWWSKTLASRGSCGFRTLWKPVDSYLLGLIDVPGSVIGMFMSVISVISCSSCAVSPSYIWQNGVQTAYVSRVQTVRGRTEFKSNLDPIPKPGGWGWRYRPHLCPEDTMSWKKKKKSMSGAVLWLEKKFSLVLLEVMYDSWAPLENFLWENLRFKVGKPFIQPQITFFLTMNHCLIAVLVALTIS